MSGDYVAVNNESTDADRYFNKLASGEKGKRVFIPSEDPFTLYNHTVKQFNASCNKVSDTPFEPINTNCCYSVWMVRWWTRLRADYTVYGIAFSFLINFLLGLVPVLNLANFAIWLLVYFLYERTFRPHSKNKNLTTDPFKWMIFAPQVCLRTGLSNTYYEVRLADMDSFGLQESHKAMLRSRAASGYVTFMVYNARFQRAFTRYWVLRVFHLLQLVLVASTALAANFELYPRLGIDEFWGLL